VVNIAADSTMDCSFTRFDRSLVGKYLDSDRAYQSSIMTDQAGK